MTARRPKDREIGIHRKIRELFKRYNVLPDELEKCNRNSDWPRYSAILDESMQLRRRIDALCAELDVITANRKVDS
jgi:hypothetical protein